MLKPWIYVKNPNWEITYLLQPGGYYIGTPYNHRMKCDSKHYIRIASVDLEDGNIQCHIAPSKVTNFLATNEGEHPFSMVPEERYGDYIACLKSEVIDQAREWDGSIPQDIEEIVGFPSYVSLSSKDRGYRVEELVSLAVPSHIIGFADTLQMGIRIRVQEMAEAYLPRWVNTVKGVPLTPEGKCELQVAGAPHGLIQAMEDRKIGVVWADPARNHIRITQ